MTSRTRYLLFNLSISALLCFILSFTPFSLKGSYLAIFLADITLCLLLYTYIISPAQKHEQQREAIKKNAAARSENFSRQ